MDDLKNPIPGDAPFGTYLKEDRASYRSLRNALNGGQTAYRALSETLELLNNRELQEANAEAWDKLHGASHTALVEKAKDLEVFSWHIASLIHRADPLPQVAAALGILTDMVEESWDDLQPIPPEDKLKGATPEDQAAEICDLKLRPFVQLFGEVDGGGLLHSPMTNLPLVAGITYGDFLVAERDGTIGTLQTALRDALDAEGDKLTARVEALQALRDTSTRLGDLLRKHAAAHGQPPPTVDYFTRHTSELLRMLGRMAEGSGFAWPGAEEDAEAEDAAGTDAAASGEGAAEQGGGAAGGIPGFSGAAQDREAALAAVAELARFFRRAEPHSPIHLLLDRAVRWGNLPLGELYSEILTEGSQGMAQMTLMTGLESVGFSDSYKKSGKPAAAAALPTLSDYTQAVPKPAAKPAAAAAVPDAQAETSPEDPGGETPPGAEGSDDGEPPKMADFQW